MQAVFYHYVKNVQSVGNKRAEDWVIYQEIKIHYLLKEKTVNQSILIMEIPKITKIDAITPEQAAEYVRFVATLRHNQNRWFRNKNVDALNISRQMEKELDELNGRLLNPVPSLFD